MTGLIWAKIAAMGLTAFLGVVAVFADLRLKGKRKPSAWGWFTIAGIVVSFAFSAMIQRGEDEESSARAAATADTLRVVLETARQTVAGQSAALHKSETISKRIETILDSQEAAVGQLTTLSDGLSASLVIQDSLVGQSASLLLGVRRGLQPLKDVKLSVSLYVPLEYPPLAPYLARIRSKLDEERASTFALDQGWDPRDRFVSLVTTSGNLFPDPLRVDEELDALALLLNPRQVRIDVYSPVGDRLHLDLRLSVELRPDWEYGWPSWHNALWLYGVLDGREFLRFDIIEAPAAIEVRTEAMASLLDWGGATICLNFCDDQPGAWVDADRMTLTTGDGLRLSVEGLRMADHGQSPSCPEFVAVLPDTFLWRAEPQGAEFQSGPIWLPHSVHLNADIQDTLEK